jgi:hypothetical protein
VVFSTFDDGTDGWTFLGGGGSVSVVDGELSQDVAAADIATLITRPVGATNVLVEVHARVTGVAPNTLANFGIITRLSGSSGLMCDVLTDGGVLQDFALHDVIDNGAGFAFTQAPFARFSDGAPFVLRSRTEGSLTICNGSLGGVEFPGTSRIVGPLGGDVGLRFRRLAARVDTILIYALD